jgi:hypothetical protein
MTRSMRAATIGLSTRRMCATASNSKGNRVLAWNLCE